MAKAPPPKKTRKGAPPSPEKTLGNLEKPELAALAPLNFKVPRDFRREFKTYASQHDMKMVELLQEGFRLIKGQHGR